MQCPLLGKVNRLPAVPMANWWYIPFRYKQKLSPDPQSLFIKFHCRSNTGAKQSTERGLRFYLSLSCNFCPPYGVLLSPTRRKTSKRRMREREQRIRTGLLVFVFHSGGTLREVKVHGILSKNGTSVFIRGEDWSAMPPCLRATMRRSRLHMNEIEDVKGLSFI